MQRKARKWTRGSAANRKSPPGSAGHERYWSQTVTQHSNALDLDPGVFKLGDPKAVAQSLQRSAERSSRRRGSAFQSAMSMLTFYINRAGRRLPDQRRRVLENAKAELRKAFGRA